MKNNKTILSQSVYYGCKYFLLLIYDHTFKDNNVVKQIKNLAKESYLYLSYPA